MKKKTAKVTSKGHKFYYQPTRAEQEGSKPSDTLKMGPAATKAQKSYEVIEEGRGHYEWEPGKPFSKKRKR